MIALINKSLAVTGRIQPEKMALNLEERKSTASFDLPIEAASLSYGDWLKDETDPGKGIIWRIKSVGKQFEKKTVTIQLEHIINTLRDTLMFGEVTPATITGNSSATTCTAEQAVRKILSYQSIWTLGDIEFNVSNPYSFNGDNLFDALETVTSSLEDAYWDYDLSKLPFKLHIRAMSDDVACEMRLSRNIQTLRMNVDGSRMYTRFYPIGKNNIHITGNYVSKNESIYGTICKTETDQSKGTEAELRAWANERIKNHCEPSVSIQISGVELSETTGEPLDKLTLNTKCRVPVPEYSTTITEKITKLSWSDKIKEPERVNVTLANVVDDVASIINQNNKARAGAGRASAKDAEEKHAWLIDENDHVGLLAEAVAGEGADKDWSRVAEALVDGTGIHQRVTTTEKDIISANSRIDQTEDAIDAEVNRATDEEGKLSGQIKVASDEIAAEVSRSRAQDVELSGKLLVEAGKTAMIVSYTDNRTIKSYESTSAFPRVGDSNTIYLAVNNGTYFEYINGRYTQMTPSKEINAGAITLAINSAGETEAYIDANKVLIGRLDDEDLNSWARDAQNGQGVFAKFLTVKRLTAAEINTLLANMEDATIGGLNVSGHADVSSLTASVGITSDSIDASTLNDADIDDMIASASVSGNTLTLTTVGGETINFSKATTLAGVWSSGTFTVSASPQGSTITTALFDLTSSDVTWNGRVGTAKVYANLDGGETKYDTGKTLTVTAPVQHPTLGQSWSNGTLTVTASPMGDTATFSIFDLRASDVTWNDDVGTIKVYANFNGGETRYDTGKRLTVTAPTAPITPTTLSGSWSSGKLTVSASPQGTNITFALFDLRSSDITWNSNTATVKVYANVDDGETRYDTGKTLSVDASGRYTAGQQAATVSGSWSSGTFTAQNVSNTNHKVYTALASPASSDISWNGDVATVSLYAYNNGSETRTSTGKSITVNASGRYSAGQKAATVSGSWSGGKFTAQNTSNTDNKVYTDLASPASSDITWSGSTATIKIYAYNNGAETKTDTGKSITVTAPNFTPTITGTAVSDDSSDHNPGVITISGSGIVSTDQNLQITHGSWSGGKMATNIRMGSSSGTLIARKWASIPSITESCASPAAFNYRITASCGGKKVVYLLKTNSAGGWTSFNKTN